MFGMIFVFGAVTVYMAVAAIEDYKTKQVTRWKHLIAFIPVLVYLIMNRHELLALDYIGIFLFSGMFMLAGYLKVYGMADAYVLVILSLLFGSIGGIAGVGMIVLIMVLASVLMLVNHVLQAVRNRKKLFENRRVAFVPHLFAGYIIVIAVLLYKYSVCANLTIIKNCSFP